VTIGRLPGFYLPNISHYCRMKPIAVCCAKCQFVKKVSHPNTVAPVTPYSDSTGITELLSKAFYETEYQFLLPIFNRVRRRKTVAAS